MPNWPDRQNRIFLPDLDGIDFLPAGHRIQINDVRVIGHNKELSSLNLMGKLDVEDVQTFSLVHNGELGADGSFRM